MSRATELLPLHAMEFGILLVLLEGDAHAYAIVSELELREPEQHIYPASLYRRLSDMVDAGLLEERPVPLRADARRKRYYRITAFGREVAREEAHRLQRQVQGARRLGLLRQT